MVTGIRRPNILTWRTAVQVLFVGLTVFVAVRHQFTKGPSGTVPVDSYCPMGGVVAIYQYVATGGFLRELSTNNFVMLGVLVGMVLIAKSVFCGWMCPFGTVQEWLAKLGRTITGKRIELPPSVDRPARYLKVLVLVAIVVLTAWTGRLVFKDWDPFVALLHLGAGRIATTAYVVLGVVLIASLFVERVWCKYLCPLAPVVGILGKLSLIKVERNRESCKDCQNCNKVCPMTVDVCNATRVHSMECNGCLECIAREPLPKSLAPRFWRPSKNAPWQLYPASVIVLVVAGIGLAEAAGHWHVTKLPHQRGGGGHGRHRMEGGPRHGGWRAPEAERRGPRSEPTDAGDAEDAGVGCADHSEHEGQGKGIHRKGRGQGRGKGRGAHGGRGHERTVRLPDGSTVEIRGYMTFAEVAHASGISVQALLEELELSGRARPTDRIGRTMRSQGLTVREVRSAVRRLTKR